MQIQGLLGTRQTLQDILVSLLLDADSVVSASGKLSSPNLPGVEFQLYGFGFGTDDDGKPTGEFPALDLRSTELGDLLQANFDLVLSLPALIAAAALGSGDVNAANFPDFYAALIGSPTNSMNYTGSRQRDTVEGFAGNDTIDTGGGKDKIILGGGNDTIFGGRGMDTISGEALSGPMDANLKSGKVTHADGSATVKKVECIVGTDHDDDLRGNNKDNCILGRDGDDVIVGLDGHDVLRGEGGNDIVLGGIGDDSLRGDGGADELSGGAGVDVLVGGTGNDDLNGGSENDVLDGGAGNDTIEGGSGDDDLKGGGGRDVFVFTRGADEGRDEISGFKAGDDTIRIVGGNADDVTVVNDPAETLITYSGESGGLNQIHLLGVTLAESDIVFDFT